MTSPLKLSQLRHLVAVVEAGTVREAARVLFLSQSSVTKSIQQLEQSVGTALLQRSNQGVVATPAGKVLIARARAIENELREARNDIESILGMGGGEIRVAASPTVATSVLPRTVLEFKRTHPLVTMQLQEGIYPDVLQAVRRGEIDFAICLVAEWAEDETVSMEILLRDRVVPAVRSSHPMRRRQVTMAELVEANWIIYRRGRTGRDIFERTFQAAGFEPPQAAIECSSFTCLLALLERGDYVSLMPEQLLIDATIARNVAPLSMDGSMPDWNVAVIHRANHDLSPVCLAFQSELRRCARLLLTGESYP